VSVDIGNLAALIKWNLGSQHQQW